MAKSRSKQNITAIFLNSNFIKYGSSYTEVDFPEVGSSVSLSSL